MGQHLGSTDVAGIVAVVYLKFSESQSLVNTTDTLDNWATPRGRAFSVEIQSAQNTVLSVQCEPVSEISGDLGFTPPVDRIRSTPRRCFA